MFDGAEITSLLVNVGYDHVVWIPDSTSGQWEAALEATDQLQLVRVCREGEAWPLAAGLYLGGHRPLVMMQSTGLFESGDALRNVVFDLRIPLQAMIGIRNWLHPDSPDSARRFAMPIVEAWGLSFVMVESADQKPRAEDHLNHCVRTQTAGLVLLAEGKG